MENARSVATPHIGDGASVVHRFHKIHSRLTAAASVSDNFVGVGSRPLLDPRRPMAEPASQQSTQVIQCIECCQAWQVPSERWRMYITDDDPPEAVAYCLDCATREFDSD